MNVNQDQLIIFKTVIETGSFSAAARQLNKVPSAVSMSIANLEIDLNLQLFERIGREPKPTSAALKLYEKTSQLLVEINQWKQQAYALSTGLESVLNIVIVSELMNSKWTDYVSILANEFPSLQVNIMSAPQEDALMMLLDQTAQFAWMFEREHLDHREQFIEITKESLVPVASIEHPLAQTSTVKFEDILTARQIVVASRNSTIQPELLFSKNYWRTDSHHSACKMILKNLGWGVLPSEMLNYNPKFNQQLKILDIQDFNPKFEYYIDLVWSRESQLGAAAQFLIEYARSHRH